jgi:hypothetical protein
VKALNSEKAMWKPEMLKYIPMQNKYRTKTIQRKQASEFQQQVQITKLAAPSKDCFRKLRTVDNRHKKEVDGDT